jgi:hypothetical protein
MKTRPITFVIVFVMALLVLMGFTQRSLKQSLFMPDSKEEKDVIKTIKKAYKIDAEVAYTLDLSKLPTVYINDPRFPLDVGTLQVVRDLTQNPSLESAGFLDYKMAYYSWRRDATLLSDAIHEKAKSENRDLTEDEKKSLIDPQGRIAPPRPQKPDSELMLTFLSMEINDDIALVVLDTVGSTVELTLVFVDNNWYVAGLKGISNHP